MFYKWPTICKQTEYDLEMSHNSQISTPCSSNTTHDSQICLPCFTNTTHLSNKHNVLCKFKTWLSKNTCFAHTNATYKQLQDMFHKFKERMLINKQHFACLSESSVNECSTFLEEHSNTRHLRIT